MTTTDDRPIDVLDRPRETVPQQADRPRRTAPQDAPAPLGWGSHAERRLMRQVLLFFALLGLYAVGFVLVGAAVWT